MKTPVSARCPRRLRPGCVWAALPLIAALSACQPPEPPPTAVVERGTVELIVTAAARLEPAEFVDVGAEVSGQLRRIHFEEGATVEAGEVVATLDDELARNRLLEAEATLDDLRAQRAEALAQRDLAERRARRYRQLQADDALSQEELEIVEAELRVAMARLEALAAKIRQAEAARATAETNLRFTTLRAPISGTVVIHHAREGQTLNASQQAPEVLRIARLDRMRVVAEVSEADVPQLTPGIPAWFTTLGAPGERRQGRLEKVLPQPVVETGVVLYRAQFEVDNPDARLLPDMTAQVFFVTERAEDVLHIPARALRERQGERGIVELVGANGRPLRREVVLGLSDGVRVAVLEGLAEGDTLLLPERRR